MRYYIGIDYSISSPAMTIYDSIEDTHKSFFFNSYKTKSFHGLIENFQELSYPIDKRGIEKYAALAQALITIIKQYPPHETLIGIEGYAFGATGRVFHIAENCGILKFLLSENGYMLADEERMSPNIIKKYATGKGNAKKHEMLLAFVKKCGYNPLEIMTPNKSIDGSFVADIVDSYFIAKYVESLI